LQDCRISVYDTEQQVIGNHLLCAWETLGGTVSRVARPPLVGLFERRRITT